MPQNPAMSSAVQEAMKRRQMGSPSPAMGQVSPQAAMANPVPQPMPQSQMTKASAPQGAAPAQKFQPQDRADLITMALIEELKNDGKLKKEQAAMQPAPQGGGMGMHKMPSGHMMSDKAMGGGFSMSPGYEQPMPVNQMQGDYQSGKYSGLNNYGQGGV